MDVTLSPFQPEDQAAVQQLILAGLAEHWGALDPALNRDLDDIAATYASALFLVARRDGAIVGAGALIPRAEGIAEIVRMSVATSARRGGVGSQILRALCEYAQTAGCRRVVLETTATWREVIAFYQRFGFQITHYCDGDVYFALTLEKES